MPEKKNSHWVALIADGPPYEEKLEKRIEHKLSIGTDQNINEDKYSFGLCHAKVFYLVLLFRTAETNVSNFY